MWKLAFLAFAHNPRYASSDALRSCKRHTGEDEVLWISQVPQEKTHSRRSETRMIPDCAGVVGFCQPVGIHPLSRNFRSEGGLGQLQEGNVGLNAIAPALYNPRDIRIHYELRRCLPLKRG